MFHKLTNPTFNQQGRSQDEVAFSFLSSNNPDFFIKRKGYVICVNELVFHLKAVHVSLNLFLISALSIWSHRTDWTHKSRPVKYFQQTILRNLEGIVNKNIAFFHSYGGET